MVLVEVDHVGLERRQRRLARGADVLGAPVELPRLPRARVAALGGDEHAVAAAAQRLGDQPLVVADVAIVARVRVRGVDQVHAGVQRRVDRADRPVLVGPALERERHPAESDREDLGVAERACVLGRGHPCCLPEAHVFGRDVVAQSLV